MEDSTFAVDVVAEVRNLSTRFGRKEIHEDISLTVRRGEILAIVGGSGSGKSTLLREMAALQYPTGGSVSLFGQQLGQLSGNEELRLRRRIGVLFQYGALLGGLSVLDNVGMPLREHTPLSGPLIDELAAFKLSLTGLQPDAAALYPNQLSGGMRKRAALARALALDPELVFLDEPTSGLDPVSADGFDDLVLDLKSSLDFTVVMVTHDIDSLWRVSDRVALLGDARLLQIGTVKKLAKSDIPGVKRFFQGPRGRAAQAHAA